MPWLSLGLSFGLEASHYGGGTIIYLSTYEYVLKILRNREFTFLHYMLHTYKMYVHKKSCWSKNWDNITFNSSFMYNHMQFVIHVSFTTNMTPFWFASQLIAHKMRNLRLPNLFYLLNIPIALPIIALNPVDTFYVPTLVNYFHRQRREPISLWSFTFFIGNKELY